MSALDDFAVYLAQAHGCGEVVPLDPHDPTRPMKSNASNGTAPPLLACRMDDRQIFDTGDPAAGLRAALTAAPVAILIIENAGGLDDCDGFCSALARAGLAVSFYGRAPQNGDFVVVLHGKETPPPVEPPAGFRVLAIMPTYNEEDIVAQTLHDLIAQGLDVYLLDNWSSDRTVDRARSFLGCGLIGLERFPPGGPAETYHLSAILRRVEELARKHRWADWIVLHDADERRRSPWPGIRLRNAFWRVDQSGYSCVDHVTLNFWPVDDSFDAEHDELEQYFEYFEFSDHPGHFHQRRAWRRQPRVELVASAGHDATFPGRRVYPYKFLLKHYPIRSQAHGIRKVLHERSARWNREERAQGWHRQYDETRRFVRDPRTLTRFDPETFADEYLLQRLSGAGIFAAPPPWATPPRW
jgi:hypothetical protein